MVRIQMGISSVEMMQLYDYNRQIFTARSDIYRYLVKVEHVSITAVQPIVSLLDFDSFKKRV